jgi:hypothetical protein
MMTIKAFQFCGSNVDDAELSQILKERTDEQNTFLIAVMPDYRVKKMQRIMHNGKICCSFFVLNFNLF